jgi:hypothetical protein
VFDCKGIKGEVFSSQFAVLSHGPQSSACYSLSFPNIGHIWKAEAEENEGSRGSGGKEQRAYGSAADIPIGMK